MLVPAGFVILVARVEQGGTEMTQAVGSVRSAVLAMWVALFVASVLGCGSRDGSGEFYTDWDLAGGCSSTEGGAGRPSGAGGMVDICADVGRYDWIWVTYAAAWCSSSGRQAPQIRAFATSAGPRVKVYTVLTSGTEPFVGATEHDARAWAGTHRLPASHVLAEQSTRVIPQHLLIGPDGRTWYRYVSSLGSEEMSWLLREFEEGAKVPDVRPLRRR